MKYMLASLRLVYPPISNREADWLLRDEDARKHLDQARIYLIGQRQEIFFRNLKADEATGVLNFTLEMGEHAALGTVDCNAIGQRFGSEAAVQIGAESGAKIIRVFEHMADGTRAELEWFTPDKLLFNAWRGSKLVSVTNYSRAFSTFDLLYIGMSRGSAFKNSSQSRTISD